MAGADTDTTSQPAASPDDESGAVAARQAALEQEEEQKEQAFESLSVKQQIEQKAKEATVEVEIYGIDAEFREMPPDRALELAALAEDIGQDAQSGDVSGADMKDKYSEYMDGVYKTAARYCVEPGMDEESWWRENLGFQEFISFSQNLLGAHDVEAEDVEDFRGDR